MDNVIKQYVKIDGKEYERTLFTEDTLHWHVIYRVKRDGEHWSQLVKQRSRKIIARIESALR